MTARIQLVSKTPGAAAADWRNNRTAAWVGYDVASSVYFGVGPALLLPLYFQGLLGHLANPTAAWGGLAAAAILVSGLAALAAAALAARIDRFVLLVALSTGLVLAIALMAWNPGSSLALAVLAYFLAQSCYFAATAIYESYLPDLLPPGLRQRLSGIGWALGYLGGLVAVSVLLLKVGSRPESPSLITGCLNLTAIISAVLFAVALTAMARAGFRGLGNAGETPRLLDIAEVLRQWRHYRQVLLLMTGATALHAVISVVIVVTAPLLSARFGQTFPDLLWLVALIHVISVPSTLLWNIWLASRSRRLPMLLLFLSWAVVLVLLAFGGGSWMPVAIVSVIGCCLGATHAALRGFVAEAVPEGGGPAFLALYTAAGRVAAAIGPALFALVAGLASDQAALMVILGLTAAGSVLVMRQLRAA